MGAILRSAALGRPERLWQFRNDSLTELIARIGQGERSMRVQALEAPRVAGATDPELERRPAIRPRAAGGELAPYPALLLARLVQAPGEVWMVLDPLAPRLHAAGSLEPRDGGDEVAAREVVRRRERLALRVVRLLLGDGRAAEWA